MGKETLIGDKDSQQKKTGNTAGSTQLRASDIIVQSIENQINSGELANNTPLPSERELMEVYGASRTVIREAITTLSIRGLIENLPRFRPVVRKPSIDTALNALGGIVTHLLGDPAGVKNLYDSRVFIERALVREAAVNAKKDDIEKLRDALMLNKNAIEDSYEFYKTDMGFHRILYSIPRNPIFPAMHEAYVAWLAKHWEKMQRSPERNLVNYQNHRAIFTAILERDPDKADQALDNHLKVAWEYVRVTFDPD